MEDQVAVEEAPSGGPSSPDLTAILAAVRDMSQMVTGLASRLDAVETRADNSPHMVPQEVGALSFGPQLPGGSEIAASINSGRGDNGANYPVTSAGEPLTGNMFQALRPAYRPGQLVKLRDIPAEGKWETVGDMLRAINCNGIGRIERVLFFDESMQWVYRVRVPGLTTAMGTNYFANQLESYRG